MHLKIVNKNLPQKITTLSRFLQWTIFSVKTNPLNESMKMISLKMCWQSKGSFNNHQCTNQLKTNVLKFC